MAAIRVMPLATAAGYGVLRRVVRTSNFGIANPGQWLTVVAFGGGLLAHLMNIQPQAAEAAFLASAPDAVDLAWDLVMPAPAPAAARVARQSMPITGGRPVGYPNIGNAGREPIVVR